METQLGCWESTVVVYCTCNGRCHSSLHRIRHSLTISTAKHNSDLGNQFLLSTPSPLFIFRGSTYQPRRWWIELHTRRWRWGGQCLWGVTFRRQSRDRPFPGAKFKMEWGSYPQIMSSQCWSRPENEESIGMEQVDDRVKYFRHLLKKKQEVER